MKKRYQSWAGRGESRQLSSRGAVRTLNKVLTTLHKKRGTRVFAHLDSTLFTLVLLCILVASGVKRKVYIVHFVLYLKIWIVGVLTWKTRNIQCLVNEGRSKKEINKCQIIYHVFLFKNTFFVSLHSSRNSWLFLRKIDRYDWLNVFWSRRNMHRFGVEGKNSRKIWRKFRSDFNYFEKSIKRKESRREMKLEMNRDEGIMGINKRQM